MNSARIVVLAIAIGAGGIAAYLASGSDPKPVEQAAEPAPQLNTIDVLVARADIPIGQTITDGDLEWQSWPATAANATLIRRTDRGNAVKDLVGSIARGPFFGGEPIRDAKLVKGDGSGFMAAILPTGMRAVSTEISPETGAGGFILPNDRVDVIASRRERQPDRNGGADNVSSEIILNNVRVLAIDQTVEEKNGQKVVVGKTATLELKPEQSETLVRARQLGTLSLALRSIVDTNAPAEKPDERRRRGETINIVRYGVSTTAATQK